QSHDGEHGQRLAGAALTDDSDRLALPDVERDVADDRLERAAPLHADRQTADGEECVAHRSSRRVGAGAARGGSSSGAAPGTIAPRITARDAPVQLGIAPASPFAVRNPTSAIISASFHSHGTPNPS